ncbi:hypothetical protein ASPSYDRAFT_59311 [Aspergillus sydowii CBS 593.65]|uniref:Phosphoglucomutase n=1 Tax=Aspergillus sydowii CBS 593.65 TaxID=1036612 RepID=A0A1L9TBN3_9EURO|nr:uncharacterized protein ASPSYDRAFT_59311 [Aspergillus sydowii CBS 593.65]OJJ56839.1 hypothetical protein ASPSYDRAFT_59311 [Aspergillus sydowii CBS 593.65]
MASLEDSLSPLIQKWLEWDQVPNVAQDPTTRSEIEQLRDSRQAAELERRLRKRIQFGTAGLRGRMAAGFSCMNSLTVIQASQGLAKYLRDNYGDLTSRGVIIGHDARTNSAKFAVLAANAFIAQEIPVWFFSGPAVTPVVPFAVTDMRALAGVMVTASHATKCLVPPSSVYFKNGCQINSPMDKEISDSIERNLEPWPKAWTESPPAGDYFHPKAYEQLLPRYTTRVWHYSKSTVQHWRHPKPFVYTPLHGVGGLVLPDLCRSLGITDFTTVAEQTTPDPNFPTLPFPNPEETGALDLAVETADREGKTLIIANDPDADRFAAAEKVDGSWFFFTGNHMGALLASHLFDSLENIDTDTRVAVLNSAVSSTMLEKMATARNIFFEESLTGFKWMGNTSRNLEESGYYVTFAFEEALGYMFPEVCYDKDGITAAMIFLSAQARWATQGLTPYTKLQKLFDEFGHHETLNNYFRSPNPETSLAMFDAVRAGPFKSEMRLGSFKILRWRDMTEGFDSGTPDKKPQLPADKSSQMLTLWLDRDVRFTIRASGTEAKVKFYIESCGSSSQQATDAVCDTLRAVIKEWIQPFAPQLTYNKQLSTSSGHVLRLD